MKNLRIFRLPTSNDFVIVHWRKIDKKIRKILMAPITEEQEQLLDEGNFIEIITHCKGYVLSNKDVIVYGVIDFSEGSLDMDFIYSLNWCADDYFKGMCIPSRYNYNKHTALGNDKGLLYYDTIRCDTILKYKHGCLGKPKRVVIWKEFSK